MTLEIIHLDDDIQTLERFAKIFRNATTLGELRLHQFENQDALLKHFSPQTIVDVFLLDVSLSPGDSAGLDVARICREKFPSSAILMCSASKDLNLVRDSLGSGADDFVTKDWSPEAILQRIKLVLSFRKIRSAKGVNNQNVVGGTMRSILDRIPQIIDSAVNCVYIEGESGTGKEVVASLIESHCPSGMPFIKLNCGSIAPTLIASELFGYIKGAFTGANSDKKGLLESASGGWIFLDEIATLPPEAQAGLLRVIENQSIRRVGANHETKITLRIISATNEPLSKLVELGQFRTDLWQRLCETQINLPPLRLRKDEIPEIVQHFCQTMRGGPYTLAPLVLDALKAHDWPAGNIRELRNCLRAMTEKSSGGMLTPSSLPESIWHSITDKKNDAPKIDTEDYSLTIRWSGEERPTFELLTASLLIEIIRTEFRKNGPMSMRAAAKAAGIPKSTMSAKLDQIINQNLISRKELQLLIKSLDGSGDGSA